MFVVSAVHAGPGPAGSDVEPGPGSSAEDAPHADVHEAASAAADLLHGGSGPSQTVRAPAAAARSAAALQHGQKDQVPRRQDAGLLLGPVVPDGGRSGSDGRQDEEAGQYVFGAGRLRRAPRTPV